MDHICLMIQRLLPQVLHELSVNIIMEVTLARYSCRSTPFGLQRTRVCLAELKHALRLQAVRHMQVQSQQV